MSRTVAVVRGGPSSRFAESLKTGKAVSAALLAKGYRLIDVVVDQAGQWIRGGKAMTPRDATRGADVAWNASHGEFGEDGQLQRTLRQLNLPFTGSSAAGGALSLAKHHSREILTRAGVKVPVGLAVARQDDGGAETVAPAVFRAVPMPAVVKPSSGGFSRGVTVVATYPELVAALDAAFQAGSKAIVEELIAGREATVGVAENFRGEALYCFPAAEVCLAKGDRVLTEEAKRAGVALVCPGRFSEDERAAIFDAARKAHEALGLRHLSRVDLIVHPSRGVFVLEANANPELGAGERLPRAIESVGATLGEVAANVVELAISPR